MQLNKALRATLDLLLDELESLSLHIAKAKMLLKSIACEHQKCQIISNLQTVPGVGEVISYTFATEIFQAQRFETKEQVSSYAGLAPQVKQSGESKARSRLRSVGQKHLRCALTEGAWIWIRHEPEARAFYDRIRAKTNLPQKAIIAVARKLLIVLWRIAVENRPYRFSTAA